MSSPRVEPTSRLTEDQVTGVRRIAALASATDGVYPLAEQFELRVRSVPSDVRHLLGYLGDELAGYAQLDLADPAGAAGEVVVAPAARRRGVGTALVTAATGVDPVFRVWAHGGLPAASGFAKRLGYVEVRSLWLMRRPLAGAGVPLLPEPAPPAGVQIGTFRPGADEESWLRANARAFATHPEQGRMTLGDLLARERTDWFDPRGFFVAWRDGRLTGFHWTKVDDVRIGEVYLLGVDPDEQGTGLGKTLLLRGLRHLRELGLQAVTLYVEADNAAGVALYRKLGFAHVGTDTMYGRPPA